MTADYNQKRLYLPFTTENGCFFNNNQNRLCPLQVML